MAKIHTAVFFAIAFVLLSRSASASHPTELLADVVEASPIIFAGKIVAARKTDKFITQRNVNYYYYVFTIKIDTMLNGDVRLRQFEIMDFPGSPTCIDTSKNAKFLFFLSKSPYVAEGVTDWMAERQYKIVKGTISPTDFIDVTGTQPLKTVIKKIGDIVREKAERKSKKPAQ